MGKKKIDKYYMAEILRECRITQYLEDRDIVPVKTSGGKAIYHCPLHKGDHDPSFTVYPDAESHGENYFCYGCHSGTTILNLVSEIEGISVYEAYLQLLKKINVNEHDRLQYQIASIQDFDTHAEEIGIGNIHQTEHLYLKLNIDLRSHWEYMAFDDDEMKFWDPLLPLIDRIARKRKTEDLQTIYDRLTRERGFEQRVKEWQKRQTERLVNNPWMTLNS